MAVAADAESDAAAPSADDSAPFVATVIDEFVGWLRKRVEEGSK